MSGDYSKRAFSPNKDFTGVLQQQGRVQLDSDWNEYVDIQDRQWRAETLDIVGASGVPEQTPDGFKIGDDGTHLTVGPGRIYVDGILCDNHCSPAGDVEPPPGETRFRFEPQLGELRAEGTLKTKIDKPAGPCLIFLEVWQRDVGPVEDPTLVETAVNVDTATRRKTEWAIRTKEIDPHANLHELAQQGALRTPDLLPSAGRLSTKPPRADQAPCDYAAPDGPRGPGNRLYRVEIHDAEPDGSATFKFSRDNASFITEVTGVEDGGTTLVLKAPGRDQAALLKKGDRIELRHDQDPDAHARLDDDPRVRGDMVIVAENAIDKKVKIDRQYVKTNARTWLVRWDHKAAEHVTALKVEPDNFVELENGIQVKFELPAGGQFRRGDYWQFTKRAAGIDELTQAPPRGIHRHYCLLAFFDGQGYNNFRPFASLTSLTRQGAELKAEVDDLNAQVQAQAKAARLVCVGGDGQIAQSDGSLRYPLQVAVYKGSELAKDGSATVEFRIFETAGDGGTLTGNVKTLSVPTNEHGIAPCTWTLRSGVKPPDTQPRWNQQVQATLTDPVTEEAPLLFNASLPPEIVSYGGGDGQVADAQGRLAQPLRVNVFNGYGPVPDGRKVRFAITSPGAGTVSGTGGVSNAPRSVDVPTTNGVAECTWVIDVDPQQLDKNQTVEAQLLDTNAQLYLGSIQFRALLESNRRIHLQSVTLVDTGKELALDEAIRASQLKMGLDLVVVPRIEVVARATCFVSLDIPIGIINDTLSTDWESAFVPTVLAATATKPDNTTIRWLPLEQAMTFLNTKVASKLIRPNEVLCHLTIHGNRKSNQATIFEEDTVRSWFRLVQSALTVPPEAVFQAGAASVTVTITNDDDTTDYTATGVEIQGNGLSLASNQLVVPKKSGGVAGTATITIKRVDLANDGAGTLTIRHGTNIGTYQVRVRRV